ncbi:MAG: hypothetical protein H3C54_01405 [Taibaiella sp.]|nr:hypothetical protein [Taibaiella sp.]
MRRLLVLITLSLSSLSSTGKSIPVLDSLFINSLSKDYSEESMIGFFNVVDSLDAIAYLIANEPNSLAQYARHRNRPAGKIEELSQLSDSIGMDAALELLGSRHVPGVTYDTTTPEWYYLPDFKNEPLYVKGIRQLLFSANIYQRAIAYKLIGATKDTVFSPAVVKSIGNEGDNYAGVWNAYAVSQIARKATTEIFEYIVKYEHFGDAHIIPLYLQMDTLSILNTSYRKISDTNKKAQVLALQAIALLDSSERPLTYITTALNTWDEDLKGYAVAALGMYQKSDLLQYLKPLAANPKLKPIIIQVLRNSSSNRDREFANSLSE